MSTVSYKKSCIIETKKVVDPNTFWEFIYKFYNEFNYEINEIDIKTNEHERFFRIRFLYAMKQPTRFAQIEFDGYESKLKYKISNCEDLDFTFKRETKFIEKNA